MSFVGISLRPAALKSMFLKKLWKESVSVEVILILVIELVVKWGKSLFL